MQKLPVIILLTGLFMFVSAKIFSPNTPLTLNASVSSTPISSSTMIILAGPFRGLVADYDMLSTFTIYDQIKSIQTEESREKGWSQLAKYLNRASDLDPWFMDPYRLTSGLLAYSGYGTISAVKILAKGANARDWDWELPFLTGFIAYDQLNDRQLAFNFMNKAAKRPNAPPMTIGLASRILSEQKGNEASIRFLQYLLKTMPSSYHRQIRRRIQELRSSSSIHESQ